MYLLIAPPSGSVLVPPSTRTAVAVFDTPVELSRTKIEIPGATKLLARPDMERSLRPLIAMEEFTVPARR